MRDEEVAVTLFARALWYCRQMDLDAEHMLDAAEILHAEDVEERREAA